MKQVIAELKSGAVRVVETPVPKCGPSELLVRNAVSMISPGTEKLLIEMGKRSLVGKAMARPDLVRLAFEKAKREGFSAVFREAMARLDEPTPLGYSSAGSIAQVGEKIRGFRVGDAVACVGHAVASHAEYIIAPPELCVKLPRTVSGKTIPFDHASFVALGGIALHGIRSAHLSFGESLVVVGLGLIGLLSVQIAEAYGCSVVGVDVNPTKLRLAKRLGCRHALLLGKDDVEGTIINLTNGHGADAVVLTAATKDNSPIQLAERVARRRGRIVLVGVSDLSLSRKEFWDKELAFTVSKGSGPSLSLDPSHTMLPLEFVRWDEKRNVQEFLRLLAKGSVKVDELVTHRYPIENAAAAYEMIVRGRENYIGVLIDYPQRDSQEKRVQLRAANKRPFLPSRLCLGVIGGGQFTKNFLLPAIRNVKGVRLVGIATKSGSSARHVGDRFGFEYATTEYEELLKDERIGSVVIGTRHDLHAAMVAEALGAGKHVFVEKPLCIHPGELRSLVKSFDGASEGQAFLVGFNRRYSPLALRLKQELAGRTTALQAHIRVNAGYIPREHWTQEPNRGGGRIIGEVCHFVDFLQFLTDSDPVEVFAAAIDGSAGRYLNDDNVSIILRFADGSLGSIVYTALGTKTFGRERAEVYWEGAVAVLEDFRRLELIRGTRKRRARLWNQDMGYANEMKHFLTGAVNSAEEFRRAVLTTRSTFAAVESLTSARPVAVEPG